MKKTKKPINELKGIKKEDMIPVKQKKSKRKRGIYLGYYSRLIFNVILFLSLVVTSYIFINKSIVIQEAKNVSYEEHGNTDYKVFLKDNIYYEDKYLDKNMSYIANLIDYISVDYNYKFKADTLFDGEYSYKIRADLEILNAENKTLFFTKKYDLIKEKTFTIENQNEYNIVENIKIDYDHYNSLANGFKSSYGVDTESNLIIYLDIYRNIDQNSINNPNINGNGTIKLTIPLSEKAINIKMDSMEINNKNVITSLDDYYLEDIKYLIIGIISLIVSLFLFIKIVKRLSRLSISPTDYDKTLKKILNQYDRLIVTTSSMPNLEKNNIIKLKEFVELLDAKDNLHKPIFFIEVTPHQKAYFFIQDDDKIILFTLKNIDNK